MSTKTIKVPVGKTVSWYVSEEGYVPQKGTYIMGDNAHSLNINLQTYQEAPLTMVFSGVAGTLSNIDTTKNVQYRVNDGAWTTAGSSIDVHPGDIIQFKGEYTQFDQYTCWVLSNGSIIDKVCGNIASVIDPVNYSTMTTYPSQHTFNAFFYEMRGGLIDAGDLVLPATTLTASCYRNLFTGCTLLTKAPELPAMNLAPYCYYNMFNNCDSLTVAPELPATTLADYCYQNMFDGCDGLTKAPDLLAETLATGCYNYMFRNCSHLNYIKCMSHSSMTLGYRYTNNWVNGVAATGTFVSYVHNTTWRTGISGIPTGWVNQTIGDQHTITIDPTPADATVVMNGVEQSSIYDWYGNTYTWSVSKTGYVTQSGSGVIRGDATIPVTLVLEKHTFNIVPNPGDATVIINGEERTSITADYGTAVTWSVSRDHYVSQSGSLTLTTDTTLPVNLVLESHTFAITATPVGATVVINGQTRTSLTADWGTTINWSVSAAHYTGQNGSLTLTDDVTLPVDLDLVQSTFTINTDPANIVIINGEQKTSITADYGTAVTWSVSRDHYVSQSGSYTIGDNDYSLNVSLVLQQFTFTINPTPVDTVVTINGQQRTSITADYGTAITWSVSKDHYVSQNGSLTLENNTTLPVSLVLENHTFTINTDSANTVIINGVERTTLTAPYGTAITWSVSRVGYTTQTGSYTLNQDHTESISLVINQYTFTIDTDAENTVVINGVERTSITADYGTTISWSVSREHYVTQSGSFTLERSNTLYVVLSLEQFTFTINSTPTDAIVMINGQQRSSITADYGTTISWSVSKTGYISQSGTHTLVDDYTENVTILIERHTFSISALPANTIVTINGEQRSSITADYGTSITWSVRKTGYVTQSGSLTLQDDVTLSITLVVAQFTFDIIATPSDATVYINGVERSSLTAVYGTEISWRVEKEDYFTQSDSFILTNDYSINVNLKTYSDTYLTLEILTDGDVQWLSTEDNNKYRRWSNTIYYRINGETWNALSSQNPNIWPGRGSYQFSVSAGDIVEFRGNNNTFVHPTADVYSYFNITALCNLYGNIMSIVDSISFDQLVEPVPMHNLFKSCRIRGASKLILPATTIGGCYSGMFYNCTSLIAAPELPATNLTFGCYQYMFGGCSSLTTAPTLPATTLAGSCYREMFGGCSSLTTAPALPAMILENDCYSGMFGGCSSLTTAPVLPANKAVSWCYHGMFRNCTSLNHIECDLSNIPSGVDATGLWVKGVAQEGTFVKHPNVSWSTGINGIPEGWTVIDAT